MVFKTGFCPCKSTIFVKNTKFWRSPLHNHQADPHNITSSSSHRPTKLNDVVEHPPSYHFTIALLPLTSGACFFWWLLEDGEIQPDLGDERLQEEYGELSVDMSLFATETIDDPKYHDISDNLTDRTSNEYPPEAIVEGGQDAVQLLFIYISLAL